MGDLVINEKGFVVGYLREVFYSYSILESPYSSDFNLEVMDKYNNTYLITSNGSEMFISSVYSFTVPAPLIDALNKCLLLSF